MLREFREFIKRGNLVELAVAFILGLAFASVVTAFTNIVLGAIAYVFGSSTSFDGFGVHKGTELVIPVGDFITAVVAFLIVAFSLFLIVKAYNRFIKKEETATTKSCPYCHTDIPLDATRCPNCTSELVAAS